MSLFKELKRRNVFRVTAAYVVIGWLLLQVGDVVFEALEVSASANRTLMALVLLGLIPTILFAWAFEMTPEGIKRDKDIDRSEQNEINERQTAKKLDYVTLGVLVVVGLMSLWQHWSDKPAALDHNQVTQKIINDDNTKPDKTQIEPINIDDKSLAVLPFINLANSEDNEPFTDGIHDDLITSLSKISALKVISRTSVLKYKTTDLTMKQIADTLRVAHVVEGSVQRVADQVRLNVKLVDATSGKQLWAERYNRALTASNIFDIQTEVSQEIANALHAQLSDAEVISIAKQQTNNLDAYNAYLAGRQRLLNRSTESLYQALDLFGKAIELDPNYALAYVGKADTWSLLNEYSDVSEETMMAEGLPLLTKALELDPLSAEAHTSRANYYAEANDLTSAQNQFERALTLNPNYPTTYHWYGNLLDRLGDEQRALQMYQKAAELDPISPVIQTNIGSMLSGAGQHQKALAQFDRIIELSPEFPGSASGKAGVYSNMGKLDQAIKWQRLAVDKDFGNVGRKVELAQMYLDIGLTELCQQTIDQIIKQSPDYQGIIFVQGFLDMYKSQYSVAVNRFTQALKDNPNHPGYLAQLAFYQSLAGQYKQAIDNYLVLHPSQYGKSYDVKKDNFDDTINLIWLYQITKQTDKAQQVMTELKQLLAEYSELNSDYKQAMIFALEGQYEQSAELFFGQYKRGESRGFWRGEHLPMLAEVINSQISQEFTKLYQYELSKQRERVLAFNNS